jgi:cytochrome c oxidase subunit I
MIAALLWSTDHKVVALRSAVFSAFFFIAAGVSALLMRTELAEPGLQVVSREGYAELFTMHGSTMIFLVVIPVALGACLYLVPLQVGTTQLSGARWAHGASLLLGLGGLVMWSGWLTREGPGRAGWYAYDPLANTPETPGNGMDLWVCGVLLVTVGSIVTAACILATLLRRRAPGMTLLRLPVFSWTALVTCLLVIFSFPSLVVAFGLLLADRHGAHVLGPISYQHLFWFYGHPAVYVMFFPFIGMVAEAASVLSGRRFFGYRIFVIALLGFTALSISAWGHHMFTTGSVPTKLFALTSTALIVPAGIEYFDIVATLWNGAVRFAVPMLFVFGFLLQFLVGGLTGIWVASPVLDVQAQDSYFVVAHFHYTLFAGSMFGLFAGIYLWWPKVTGRFLSERLGRLHFGLLVLGTNLTFLPQFALGQDGMARRLADYSRATGWTTLNALSTVGSFVIAVALAVFVLAVLRSALAPRTAAADAWGGGMTLEWWASSPPPPHNFDSLPPVRSYAPLYDLRRGEEDDVPAPESPEVPRA